MVCSKRVEPVMAISSSNPLPTCVRPSNFAKLVRWRLNVNAGRVTSTLPVCEFWECRALNATLNGLPGNERDHCTLDWNVLVK